MGQQALQPLRISRQAQKMACRIELGTVFDGVPLPTALKPHSNQCPGIEAELVDSRLVQLDDGLRIGPRAVEQRDEAVVENINEVCWRAVQIVVETLPYVLRQVQWQSTIGAKHAKTQDLDDRPLVAPGATDAVDGGRRKQGGGVLAKAYAILAWRMRVAELGPFAGRIDMPQERKQIQSLCRQGVACQHLCNGIKLVRPGVGAGRWRIDIYRHGRGGFMRWGASPSVWARLQRSHAAACSSLDGSRS
ncbi:hypothetical protein D3C72_1042240 [compost metagenome]